MSNSWSPPVPQAPSPQPPAPPSPPSTKPKPGKLRTALRAVVALTALSAIATVVVYANDPAPGGWINNFKRDAQHDTFDVQLNKPAESVIVSTLDNTACETISSGVELFTMKCPTQAKQKWVLAVERNDGTVERLTWDRSRFWILPVLLSALGLTVALGITAFILTILLLARRPSRPRPWSPAN
jgi:hypothetical protein